MNIHPLIVHFPIAFFITYSVFELLRIKRLTKQSFWFNLKALLVILGVISAFVAGVSGNLAERQFADQKSLIELHSRINLLASIVFSSIALAYFIGWLKNTGNNLKNLGIFWTLALKYEYVILETPLIILLAIIGLILISVGGALGGAIVYGKNFDPFTNFVYSFFFNK